MYRKYIKVDSSTVSLAGYIKSVFSLFYKTIKQRNNVWSPPFHNVPNSEYKVIMTTFHSSFKTELEQSIKTMMMRRSMCENASESHIKNAIALLFLSESFSTFR